MGLFGNYRSSLIFDYPFDYGGVICNNLQQKYTFGAVIDCQVELLLSRPDIVPGKKLNGFALNVSQADTPDKQALFFDGDDYISLSWVWENGDVSGNFVCYSHHQRCGIHLFG